MRRGRQQRQIIHHFMKMKITSLLFACLFLLTSGQIFSQNKFKIEATLLDSVSQKPLEFATVFLFLEKKDSSTTTKKPIRTGFSDDRGRFNFGELAAGDYFFEVTMVGFRPFSSQKISLENDLKLGEILMAPSSQNLTEVTVVAQKPLLEMKADRVIYNADADPSNDSGNGLDVLKKVPFITVDADDNITLKGKSNFKVQLNGRNTGLMAKNPKEALRSFPAGMIKRVEVVTSPGARYDAEGVGGIINIVTVGKIVGVNGNVSTGINTLGQTYNNLNVNAKLGDWGFSAWAGGGGGFTARSSTFERTNFYPTSFFQEKRNATGRGGHQWMNGNFEMAYDFDTLKSISFYLNANGGKWKNDETAEHFGYDSELNLVERGTFKNENSNRWPGRTWGADYIQKFKKPEQELTISWALEQGRDRSESFTDRNYAYGFLKNFATRISNNKPEDENTMELNYVHPIREGQNLSGGVKTIFRRINNEYSQETADSMGIFQKVEANSGVFNYAQNVFAGYVEYSFSKKKWSWKPGVRYEYTTTEGDVNGENPFENDYPILIPTFSVSYKISEAKSLRLAYTKRIQRPSLWYLNPQTTNLDPRYISRGNPYLDPEFAHSIELGYSIFSGMNNLNLTLEQSFTDQTINQFQQVDLATGIVTSSFFNLGSNQSTSFSANGSATVFKNLSFYSNLGATYTILKGYSGATFYENKGFILHGYASLTYKLKKGWQIQGYGWVGTGDIQLQGKNGAWYNYQGGFSKSFLKNKSIRVALLVDQFLQKERVWRNTTTDPLFTSKSESISPARAYRVSVSWRFGKLKENVSRKKGVSNSDTKSGGGGNN